MKNYTNLYQEINGVVHNIGRYDSKQIDGIINTFTTLNPKGIYFKGTKTNNYKLPCGDKK